MNYKEFEEDDEPFYLELIQQVIIILFDLFVCLLF